MQDSTIRHTAVVAIAGQKVTDDIRIGLSVLEDQAEKLKRDHGLCYADMIQEDEIITIPGIAGRPPKEIKKSVLAKIIQARVEEILEIVAIEIKRSGYASQLSAGAVITGGGSLLEGMCPLASEILGMDAKIGLPRGLSGGLVNEVKSPIYATGVGLVLHALHTKSPQAGLNTPGKVTDKDDLVSKISNRMKTWFKEF